MNFAAAKNKIQQYFGLDEASDYEELDSYEQAASQQPSYQSQSLQSSRSVTENQRSVSEPVYEKSYYSATSQSNANGNAYTNSYVNTTNSYNTNEPKSPIKPESNILSLEQATSNRTTSNRGSGRMGLKGKASSQSSKITILEPRTYTEAKSIAQAIFKNEIVIINFHLVEESQARRIVDFLTGAVYALDGDIQRLDGEMFICTPANTEIDSAIAKSLLKSQFSDF